MKTLMVPSIFALLMAAPAVALAAPAGAVTAEASATITADVDVEVSDDILLVLDLPIAAAELRADGVEDAEISEAIDATAESGASVAVATEAMVNESAEVKARGHKKGFGLYVRKLVADGYRGTELAAKIKERKDDFTLTDEERDAVKAELKAKHDAEKARRKEVHDKLVELRKEGKVVQLRGEALHARLDEARKVEKAKHHAKVGKIKHDIREERRDGDGDKDAVKELRGDLKDERKDHHEKMDHLKAADAKLEKRDEKVDAAIEKRADRIEAREDRREERKEKIEEKKAGGPGAKKAPQ
ncbi:MAG: hypothetical protein R3B09_15715 [Nannocystaceae bacterium]